MLKQYIVSPFLLLSLPFIFMCVCVKCVKLCFTHFIEPNVCVGFKQSLFHVLVFVYISCLFVRMFRTCALTVFVFLFYSNWCTNSHQMQKIYKVVQIRPRLFVCKQVTVCPGHIWTTLYIKNTYHNPAITHNFMCKRLFKFIKEL
jgi:hypothetical protein